jgi:menaquinone-specific isochorismate synthase
MSKSEDLHGRTVPLDYGPDALQFDGTPTVLFDRPGLTLVGWGTASLVDAHRATEVLASIPCDDPLQRPGSGALALGALPFDATLDGQLVIPRFAMGIARQPDGGTVRWATAIGPADVPLPSTDELFDSVIWQYGNATEGNLPDDVAVDHLEASPTSEGYEAMVARVVATLREPRASVAKVVLSRQISASLHNPLPLAPVLRRLRALEPNCTIFLAPLPDGTFFGASPELLVARHGRRVFCHPLAGTVPRGDTARRDADAQGRLFTSGKDRAEHRFVVDGISESLSPFCTEMSVPAEPALVPFRAVAHLGTRIDGALRADTPVLTLLEAVHPTPAVGGSPRPEALHTIAAAEPVPRGYWAGPVGWVDARGDGEWFIGIRSACLDDDGTTLTLHAGAGVVADSDPAAEAAEVDVKLASVLESIVPGGAAHLR